MSNRPDATMSAWRPLARVLLAGVLGLSVGACGLLDTKTPYVRSGEVEPLQVPADLDTPGYDPSLTVPPSTSQQLLSGADLAPPPLGSNGPASSGLSNVGTGNVELLIADNVENTWLRIGQALDRSGAFAMLERNREQASYRVGIPAPIVRDERPWWRRTLGWGEAPAQGTASEVLIKLSAQGDRVRVQIQDESGSVITDDRARRVISVVEQRLGLT